MWCFQLLDNIMPSLYRLKYKNFIGTDNTTGSKGICTTCLHICYLANFSDRVSAVRSSGGHLPPPKLTIPVVECAVATVHTQPER
ncbi:hypothetical protein BDR03DRAFT_955220 [Suillus americanus]|nr:hypothetical protein BDR03DRAFT_955220 [Suillus americanus]